MSAGYYWRGARFIGGSRVAPFRKTGLVKQGRVITVFPSPLNVAGKIIKKRFEDVKSELLAHLPEAIHGRLSVLHVAICHVTICRVAICRVAISQWVLHAVVISIANGKRVQPNNQ